MVTAGGIADVAYLRQSVAMSGTSASEHGIPRRVLVVDDDGSIRESFAALLRDADFEVVMAADGEEALTFLGRQWCPVVVTNRTLPVLDGIEFVWRLRAMAVAPIYVIMLTVGGDAHDYERGYCAGVDHYLAKKGCEAELLGKVVAGMSAIRRRQSAHTGRSDRPVTVDLENGAHTARHLVGRLHAEMQHARRTGKPFHVLSACIELTDAASSRGAETTGASEALLHAVYAAARPKLDWIARLPASRRACRIAVVMPEADATQIAAIEQNIRNAFVRSSDGMRLTVGAAGLTTAGEQPTALGLLGEAERQRRGLTSKPVSEVGAVQGTETASGSDTA
jgi:DNA-binding response OmpR family regulator